MNCNDLLAIDYDKDCRKNYDNFAICGGEGECNKACGSDQYGIFTYLIMHYNGDYHLCPWIISCRDDSGGDSNTNWNYPKGIDSFGQLQKECYRIHTGYTKGDITRIFSNYYSVDNTNFIDLRNSYNGKECKKLLGDSDTECGWKNGWAEIVWMWDSEWGQRQVEILAVKKYLEHGVIAGQLVIQCASDSWDGSIQHLEFTGIGDNGYKNMSDFSDGFYTSIIFCASGYKANGSNTDCIRYCTMGYYNDTGDNCENCGKGYYCEGNEPDRKSCPPGYTTRGKNAISEEGCFKICDSGYYNDPNNRHKCIECPAGSYCPKGSDQYTEKKSCIDDDGNGNGNTSIAGATSEDQCHTPCSNSQYLPANSINCEACPDGYLCKSGNYRKKKVHQGIYLCPGGYFLDKDNKTKINHRTEDLVVKETVCSHCRGLYDETYTNTSNKDIVNNLYFYSNRFCLSSDYGKPKPDKANNSSSNLDTAKKSCYISGSVNKDWGDNTINNLEIMDNCFYDDQDGNKTVEGCNQPLPGDGDKLHNPDVDVA